MTRPTITPLAPLAGEGPGARVRHGTLRFLGRFDPQYDVLEIRRQGSGELLPILTYRQHARRQATRGTVAISPELFDGRVWPDSRLIEMPGGHPAVLQLRWLNLIRRPKQQRAAQRGKPSIVQPQPPESGLVAVPVYSTNLSYRTDSPISQPAARVRRSAGGPRQRPDEDRLRLLGLCSPAAGR